MECGGEEGDRPRGSLETEAVEWGEVLGGKVTVLGSYASGGIAAGCVLGGALAFGAGVAIGAAMGRAGEDGSAAAGAPDSPGLEPTLQELHPDIHDIPLHMIDFSDSPVHDAADYHKVSKAEMLAGFEKLTQVRRWISQGATEQQLYDESRAKGLSEVQSYHNIYRVFYGESAIALEKVGDRYRVINGYHRLAVAQELDWTTIPAKVINS